MIINADTKISTIVKCDVRAIDVLMDLNPLFKKLKNPIFRKVLASGASVADAAKIGNCTVDSILTNLHGIGFDIEQGAGTGGLSPKVIPDEQYDIIVDETYDVRPDLAKGIDPFKNIMNKLSHLGTNQTLLVLNSFEPVPLINILKSQNYRITVRTKEPGVIETYITTTADSKLADVGAEAPDTDIFNGVQEKYSGNFVEIDVRALEMPQPMIAILDQLDKLPQGKALYVHHKKVPVYLLPELKERHFKYIYKQTEAEVTLLIYPE
ncbi:MAG: DUF2249 domain-containing protein [Mucilaginibacter sp.]|uniref:DUF2249 domain-containing protein n=1 Tax=Mucilaginibacter sp. TaxID=1882438 RepID=UPI003262DB8C